jgi:hypothetical protein
MIVRPSLSNHACALTRPSSFATPNRNVAACPCRASINIAASAQDAVHVGIRNRRGAPTLHEREHDAERQQPQRDADRRHDQQGLAQHPPVTVHS